MAAVPPPPPVAFQGPPRQRPPRLTPSRPSAGEFFDRPDEPLDANDGGLGGWLRRWLEKRRRRRYAPSGNQGTLRYAITIEDRATPALRLVEPSDVVQR